MGQSSSSTQQNRPQQKQISLENIRAECAYSSDTSWTSKKQHNTFKNPNRARTKSETGFSKDNNSKTGLRNSNRSSQTSQKRSRKSSLQCFRSNSSPKGAHRSIFSNDVELIVRKKLITTTTTTMNPVELNTRLANNETNAQVDNQHSKDQCGDNTNNNNQNTTMHRFVNNANPENTADAVAALIKDYSKAAVDTSAQLAENKTHNNTAKTSDLTSLPVSDAPGNNRRVSTFKKEQLEYEFRIKPQTDSKKKWSKHKNKNSLITFDGKSENRSNAENTENMVIYRRLYCCGIKCCQFPLTFSTHSEESTHSLTTYSRTNPGDDNNLDPLQQQHQVQEQVSCCCVKNNNSAFVRFMQLICCCFIFSNQKYFKVFGKKFYFQNVHEPPSFCGSDSHHRDDTFNHIYKHGDCAKKLDKDGASYDSRSCASKSSFGDRLMRRSTMRKEQAARKEGEEDDILTEEPAVTCIRVLRPSNDLTPVKFDSQYNIIQAYNSESNALICTNSDKTINEFDINEIEN